MPNKRYFAFSLIELSIVILVIGILIAGVTQGSRLVRESRLSTAKTISISSPVSSVKDLVLWLDATSNDGFDESLEDGDRVQNWYDINPQKTPNVVATQSTEANRPYYVEKGINGLPSLRFQRSSNLYLTVADDYDGDSENTTIFVVWEPNVSDTYEMTIISKWAGGSNNYPYTVRSHGTISGYRFAAYDISNNPSSNHTTKLRQNGVPDIITGVKKDGQNLQIYISGDAGDVATDTSGTTVSDTDLHIGCRIDKTTCVDGLIGEIIVFNRALKNSERLDIEDYLRKKWKVTRYE